MLGYLDADVKHFRIRAGIGVYRVVLELLGRIGNDLFGSGLPYLAVFILVGLLLADGQQDGDLLQGDIEALHHLIIGCLWS